MKANVMCKSGPFQQLPLIARFKHFSRTEMWTFKWNLATYYLRQMPNAITPPVCIWVGCVWWSWVRIVNWWILLLSSPGLASQMRIMGSRHMGRLFVLFNKQGISKEWLYLCSLIFFKEFPCTSEQKRKLNILMSVLKITDVTFVGTVNATSTESL